MLKQEHEFNAWGLSKLAVRNIVVFFLLALILTITVLWREILVLRQEKDEATKREILCKEEASKIIDQLRKEQITMLSVALERQQKIEQEIRQAQEKLSKLRRQ